MSGPAKSWLLLFLQRQYHDNDTVLCQILTVSQNSIFPTSPNAQTIDQDAARLYMIGNAVALVPNLDHIA